MYLQTCKYLPELERLLPDRRHGAPNVLRCCWPEYVEPFVSTNASRIFGFSHCRCLHLRMSSAQPTAILHVITNTGITIAIGPVIYLHICRYRGNASDWFGPWRLPATCFFCSASRSFEGGASRFWPSTSCSGPSTSENSPSSGFARKLGWTIMKSAAHVLF